MPGSGPRRHDTRQRLIAPIAYRETSIPASHHYCPGASKAARDAGDDAKIAPSTAAAATNFLPRSAIRRRLPRPAQPRPKTPGSISRRCAGLTAPSARIAASINEATELKGKSTRAGVYKCKGCEKPFTATIGTVYERSHIPLHKWLLATHLLCASKKGISRAPTMADARLWLLPDGVVHGAPHPRGNARSTARRRPWRREQGGRD